MATRHPRSTGVIEGIKVGKDKKVGEASRVLTEAGRVLRLSRIKVEASEREVSGSEQQLKEPRQRLTGNQETVALASVEERQTLVKFGNASQDLKRQKEKLRAARRREDLEEKKEFLRQQRLKRAERDASVRKAQRGQRYELPDYRGYCTRLEKTSSMASLQEKGRNSQALM